MARMYDGGGAGKTDSQAEIDLKKLFERELDSSYTVIHSVPWIANNPKKTRKPQGEIDFVIAHPQHGVLLLEVKGGRIRVECNRWYTRNRFEVEAPLDEDPFLQAEQNLYPIRGWLAVSEYTRRFKYPVFHAVAFPDTGMFLKSALRPDAPAAILLDGSRLTSPQKAIEEVFAFWQAHYPHKMQGEAAVEALVKLMVPTANLTASLAEAFRREGKQIEQLTQEQFGILKMLRLQNQAVIAGGAGTGKTVLAMEKARRLVDQGLRVLLLCFNSNLATWISQTLQAQDDPRLDVLTFHQLTSHMIRRSALPTDPRMEKFYDHAADLLQDALDRLRKESATHADLYDAIIVDEGQDFRDDWWIPLSDLLKDRDNGIMYIFFDDNQRLYTN